MIPLKPVQFEKVRPDSTVKFHLLGVGYSLCRRHNLTWDNNIGKAVLRGIFWAPNRLNEFPEVRFRFPFVLIGKLTMAFLTGQSLGTYTCTQILVHRLVPRTRISALFR